jgi:hypothetical protein
LLLTKSTDRERPSFLPWFIGGALVVRFFLLDLQGMHNGVIRNAELWGRDFINIWTGGRLIAARDFATLYNPQAFDTYQQGMFGPLDPHVYSYPPTAFPIASLFSQFPYGVALAAWLMGTGVLFVYAARRWWPEHGGSFLLAALTPAALINIWVGHYGFLFGAFFLLAFRRLDQKQPIAAGVLIGLFAIKPQLAILIPLVLLIRRDWRVIVSAIVTVVALVVSTGVIYGWSAWETFLFRAIGKQVSVIDAHGAFFGKMSASAATAILDLGGSWTLALIGQGLMAALGIGLVVVAALRRVPTDRLALLVATCTFLVLPYSINYDLTVVMIGAWVVMVDHANPVADRRLAALGFVAPQIGILLALYHLPVTSLMLASLAIAQFRVAMRSGMAFTPNGCDQSFPREMI